MSQQLARVLSAEPKRDQALVALDDSEKEQRRLAGDLAEMNRQLERRVQVLAEDFAEVLGKEGCKHLQRIRTSTHRMNELIDGMLTLARLSKKAMRREPIDLSALVKVVVDELQRDDPSRPTFFPVERAN
jgi:light-regulated signal transduction histidine kinase (bacteriophytochrome)